MLRGHLQEIAQRFPVGLRFTSLPLWIAASGVQAAGVTGLRKVHIAADKQLPAVQRVIQDALDTIRWIVSRKITESLLTRQDREGVMNVVAGALLQVEEDLYAELVGPLTKIVSDAGDAAAEELEELLARKERKKKPLIRVAAGRATPRRIKFDKADETTKRYVDSVITQTAKNVEKSTRSGVDAVLTKAWTTGLSSRETARLLRDTVGLDKKSALAVRNLRDKMKNNPGRLVHAGRVAVRVGNPPTMSQIDSVADRYAQSLLKKRSERIARNYTMEVANGGQQVLWTQQQNLGNLNKDALREVITTPDERRCPICGAMAGQRRKINEPFDYGEPPFHSLCRCTTRLVEDSVDAASVDEYRRRTKVRPYKAPGKDVQVEQLITHDPVTPFRANVTIYRTELQKQRAEEALKLAQSETLRFRAEFERLKTLRVDHVVMDATGETLPGSNALGTYWSSMDRLHVAAGGHRPLEGGYQFGRWTVSESITGTFRHELGHAVHIEFFSEGTAIGRDIGKHYVAGYRSQAQKEWTEVWDHYQWKQGGEEEIKRGLSQYALTNEKELFAESFATYTHPDYGIMTAERWKPNPKLPKNIEEYMEKWVGKRTISQTPTLRPSLPTPSLIPTLRPQAPSTRVPGVKKKLSTQDVISIRARRAAGESATEIAKAFNIHPNTVRAIVRGDVGGVIPGTVPKPVVPVPPVVVTPPTGGLPPLVRVPRVGGTLTDDQIRSIVARREAGERIEAIAADVKVHPNTARLIYRTYRSLV